MIVSRTGPHTLPLPERATPGAAGYDLSAAASLTIGPGQMAVVPTGFAFEIPEGMVGLVRPRSGLTVRRRIDVRAGVIDSDYRGELQVVLVNENKAEVFLGTGERIAQLVVVPCYGGAVVERDAVTDTARGAGGFGSTGS